MPLTAMTFADLVPGLAARNTGAALAAAAAALTLCVAALLALALRACRQTAGFAPAAFPEVEWVAPDVVKEGMSVRIDAPAATGMRSGPSVVRAIHKRWLALAALESDGLSLGVGAPLEVQIHTGPALYRFHTSVRDRRIVQGVPTLYVERPPRIEKVQRRSHFRVDLRLAAALSDLRPDSDPAEPIRGVVDSLSGGGFRICLPTELPAGTPVRLRVSDEPLAGHALEARVIRCDRGGFLSGPRFRACCEFVHLSEETRNLIVAHCFEIQREAMRSGA